ARDGDAAAGLHGLSAGYVLSDAACRSGPVCHSVSARPGPVALLPAVHPRAMCRESGDRTIDVLPRWLTVGATARADVLAADERLFAEHRAAADRDDQLSAGANDSASSRDGESHG